MSNYSPPYSYQLFNELNTASVPSTIHLTDNRIFEFHAKYLFQKAMSAFSFTLPDEWEKDYFINVVFRTGFISILDTAKYGIIPQHCTLSGINIFYEPKYAQIANPLLRSLKTLKIGEDCTIIKLMPDYSGICDIVSRYAALMALCDETTDINIFNSQLSYIFTAKDKASAETFKAAFDSLHSGEPAAAVGEVLFDEQGRPLWQPFTQNLSGNFIAPDVQTLKKKIEDEFDTIVGIPNANTEKRERLITDEVNANNIGTYCRAALWLETLQEGIKKTIELYPTLAGKLAVKWRADPEQTPKAMEVTE